MMSQIPREDEAFEAYSVFLLVLSISNGVFVFLNDYLIIYNKLIIKKNHSLTIPKTFPSGSPSRTAPGALPLLGAA
jgi:hypothetical protein